MDTATLIKEIYRKTSGEWDDTITPESDDGRTILSIINEQVDVYYNSVDQFGIRIVWGRNIDPEYVISEANDTDLTYEVDWNEVQALPGGYYMPIRVGEHNFELVPFNELYSDRHAGKDVCAISANGLTFNKVIPYTGEILFPCIVKGRHLTGHEKDVETVTGVHNILWLQMASAAEYVRTDIVRGAQYPNVLAQANDVFSRMISDNEERTAPLYYHEMPQAEYLINSYVN
jgi:hypothetical protein